MGFRVATRSEFRWLTRPHEPGEPARHVAELSDILGFAHARGNVYAYGYPPETERAEVLDSAV